MATPEEKKKRKRDAEEYWKKILAYYMMEQNRITQAQAEELMRSPLRFFHEVKETILESATLRYLLEKGEDGHSAMDWLEELDQEDEADLPFRDLLEEARKEKPDEGKLADAMSRVVTEAPVRMLERAKAENAKRVERQQTYANLADDFVIIDEEDVRYETRLRRQTSFLKVVMPPRLYRELAEGLAREGYAVEPGMRAKGLEQPKVPTKARNDRAVLEEVRDNLHKMATGKTPGFHHMLTALDGYLDADAKTANRMKNDLMSSMVGYLITDCAADSPNRDKAAFTQTMRAARALLPKDDFASLVDRVNEGLEPPVKAEDFSLEPAVGSQKVSTLEREVDQAQPLFEE